MPVAVDENGLFLFSPLSIITITATDLDIRNLNYTVDSVTVTAANLDIRNLSGSRDSVAVSSMGFVESTATQTVASGTSYLLTTDISRYRQNSFFVRNVSGSSITVAVQYAPIDNTTLYIDVGSSQSVAVGQNYVFTINAAMKFARLRVQASASTNVVAYYNGRA